MKVKIKRAYKPEIHSDPIVTVTKVIETRDVASYEESYVFPGLVEVVSYTGEVFIVDSTFEDFDKLIINADKEDEAEARRRDMGLRD